MLRQEAARRIGAILRYLLFSHSRLLGNLLLWTASLTTTVASPLISHSISAWPSSGAASLKEIWTP